MDFIQLIKNLDAMAPDQDFIRIQMLEGTITNVSLTNKGRDSKVTFLTDTDVINPTSVMTGDGKYIGMILWLEKDRMKEALAYVAPTPEPSPQEKRLQALQPLLDEVARRGDKMGGDEGDTFTVTIDPDIWKQIKDAL